MKNVTSTMSLNESLPKGGAIKRRSGSEKLYVDFYYFNHRITKSTGLDDNPVNREKVRLFLENSMRKIEERTFRFADAFPGATRKEKKYFTELEGQQFNPEPQHVNFGEYAKDWMKRVIPTYDSPTKRNDYECALNSRILPFFRKMNFYQISSTELEKFIATLKKENGKNKGEKLSHQRVKNILIPLRKIWESAANKYRWILKSPFDGIKDSIPSKKNRRTEKVFRIEEWLKFLHSAPAFYRPHMEFMVMTGVSASELSGLKWVDVKERSIRVERSIVLGEEQERLKNNFRFRRIPLTNSIKRVLEQIRRQCPESIHLFPMENGTHFDGNSFRKIVWNKALKESQIQYKTPYSTRHTFCAWALLIGMNPLKLVDLMGHSSKLMVFETYGKYVEDLEDDEDDIIRYFGIDFLVKPEKKKSPLLAFGDSYGDSMLPIQITN